MTNVAWEFVFMIGSPSSSFPFKYNMKSIIYSKVGKGPFIPGIVFHSWLANEANQNKQTLLTL